MMRDIGTVSRGIRAPIIKAGDDLESIVVEAILNAVENNNITLNNRDIIGVTESLLARAQGNFITLDNVGKDIHDKFGDEVGVVFPMLSRNRFSLILDGVTRGVKKCYVQLNYPNDEVGNPISNLDKISERGINPYSDEFTEEEYCKIFSSEERMNPFTKVDILDYYKNISDKIEIFFSNNPVSILKYTKNVLVSNIHARFRTKEIIRKAGAINIYSLDEIAAKSIDGSGYNEKYGLLGSNYSTDHVLKLFPRDGEIFVNNVQKKIYDRTGKKCEVLIYGDGAFKDPVAGIWELADPVVSPAYTEGLAGVPSELKLKYIADNANLSDDDILNKIRTKDISQKESLGTTPRRITDLVGSLCDLTSGSGDKGTPIVLIQGYFDNYANT
ncbi:MAG: coenzyme F420-0:L-glutamate ligase [Lachnoclostridium sp.]|nr:coenzyme F420-0:L-glutamate ligase [Lachnoclostridium sp.]